MLEHPILEFDDIKDYEYINCDDIREFYIPNGIKKIGERAFSKCINLRTLIIPDSVEVIGASAFSDCRSLEEIILPRNLKKIEYRTFADCKRLKKIVIPEGVEELDWAIFAGCENLEEIVLPESIKSVEKQLFLNCKKLKKVTLPEKLEYLPDEFFKGCCNLDIVLNKNIIKLGKRVFENCYKLSTYPTHIIEAGEYCFRNCRSLDNIKINADMTILANGLFDGCLNLKNIAYEGQTIRIGKRVFRNCINLKEIPSFVVNFNDRAFENCLGFTEIEIIDKIIPFACFRGCKNLVTIRNQQNIHSLGEFAFAGCINLEEISLDKITKIAPETFSNCKKLKVVKLNMGLTDIGTRAFYNCTLLEEIKLPDTVRKISKEAFKYCHSIQKIRIPANLDSFGDAAFSYMNSLERIEVSPENKTFITPDGKILIHELFQQLVLYASGCKDKSYSLKDYNVKYDEYDGDGIFNQVIVQSIHGIGRYAFAGAKNLEELSLCYCTKDIECTAFYDCPNLKKLKIVPLPFFTYVSFTLRNNGVFYSDNFAKSKPQIPFEVVEFCEGNDDEHFNGIFNDILRYFENVKKIILPKAGSYSIGERAFLDCKNLIEIDIPKNVNHIGKNAFPTYTILKFENGLKLTNLVELRHSNEYIGEHNLYVLNDETYYIEQQEKISFLSKKTIDKVCSYSEEIRENPALYLDFMNSLFTHDLAIKYLFNGILFSKMSLENREIFFRTFNKNDEFFLNVLKVSKLLEEKDYNTEYLLKDGNFVKVANFIQYLKNNNIQDKYLFQKHFMMAFDNHLFIKMLNVYDANIKRLLKMSLVDNNASTSFQNFEDLLILMYITGALEENEIIRQRAITFICEKIFEEFGFNNQKNQYRIVEDDIHRIFNFLKLREDFDEEFAQFFLENYYKLMDEEKGKSGFIQRAYVNFREISKTSTSNKGVQRHLKVTFQKCKNYLNSLKFSYIPKDLVEFANFIGAWYDNDTTWINAQRIYKESLSAPRNIFSKVTYDENGNVVYDYNPQNDLREEIREDFSFEWLPKQDFNNFVLGKFCNCCAHLEGAGSGIMRASMILDCCQNLVIKNNCGEIIAKSTIYVNKMYGYAVFNNIESSLNYRKYDDLKKIYFAFMRGAKAFLDTYNLNNEDYPINNISIGNSRNTIANLLENDKHPIVNVQQALNYGAYSISGGNYNGDWKTSQRLVLKKSGEYYE